MSSFGGSIKLTGEDEYRKALKNITQGLKEVSSELTLTTSQFDASDKKTKDLKQAQEQLAKVYENQKAKVDELKNAYNSFSQKVAEQSTKHQQLLQTYDKEKAELEKIGRTLGTTSKEYQDQRSKVESLAQEVAKSTKNEEENANALSRMGTALNKAETELNKTSKEMKDLGHDTKETSEGFSVFKMVLANLTTQAINSAIKGLQSLGGVLINVGKQALTSYADYEQLVGGVETLFKDSAGIVEKYASESYKTAGLSANEYMETVTSFSASLLQSLDGDTKKTAEYSNRAIIDMSDNANKMGTDMSSLQNAYQGFAKQNYTMLDNLKLGYGGTKSEMERLIKDASKMKDVQKELGVEVDASSMSFGNIVNAISVMQKSMDIAGTTSKEASTTISGSVNSMKSAWQNLLTGIADDNADFSQLVDNFVNTLISPDGKGGVLGNILPRVKTIVEGIGKLAIAIIEDVLPQILEQIPSLLEGFGPTLMGAINSLIESVLSAIEQLVPYIGELIPQIAEMLISLLPQLLVVGIRLVLSLAQGFAEAIPQLLGMLPDLITDIVEVITEYLPDIIQAGIQILIGLINGLTQALPQLIDYIPQIVETIVMVLIENLPLIIDASIQIMIALINGLTQSLPKLIAMVPTIIKTIVTTLINNLPQVLKAGVEIIKSLIQGIKSMISGLGQVVKSVGQGIVDGFKAIISTVGTVGKSIVEGLWNGIKNAGNWIREKVGEFARGILDGMKNALGIHSPSKVFADVVGKNIALGIGEGFTDEMKSVSAEMEGAIPTNIGSNIAINGTGTELSSYASDYSYNRIVEAFQDALSSMKIELDDEEAGKFVRKTVEQAIYT